MNDSNSIGRKIAFYRKAKGFTQEELAEKLGVTPQAVSKWENDVSCPDIALLAPLARLLGVTVDELLCAKPPEGVRFAPEEERKSLEELTLKIYVNSTEGDVVRVNLPMPLVKLGLEMGMKLPNLNCGDIMREIDLGQVLALVESGATGKLVEMKSAEGDSVDIVVE